MGTVQENQLREAKNKVFASFIITALGSMLTFASIFINIVQLKSSYLNRISEFSRERFAEYTNNTNGFSIFGFIKLMLTEDVFKEDERLFTFFMYIAGILVFFITMPLILSLFKKPIGVMVFDFFVGGVLLIARFASFFLKNEEVDRMIEWGPALYICFIGVTVSFVSSIVLLIAKIEKKQCERTPTQASFQAYQINSGYQGYQGGWGNQGYQGYQGNQGYQSYQNNQGYQGYKDYQYGQGYQNNQAYQTNQDYYNTQAYQDSQNTQSYNNY